LLRDISNSETESFAEKIKHLIKFGEKIDNKWVYRFASHPRFAFWAYNILYRRRLLGQGNYYLKQNPGDANLTLDELQELVRSGNFESIMRKLMRYTKNVSGTNAYWNDIKAKLKATINQVGAPTIFWTLSCAEFHWPEFHALFSDNEISSPETLRSNVINNPHILDWIFTLRVEKFVKHWLYEKMGATWHWYRFEYALMRGSIHCHGLVKLKGDPGLCDLSQIALNGFNAQEKLTSNDFELEHFDNLQRAVYEGKVSENKICDYVDSIVTAENPSPPHEGEWVKPKIHPCKKKFKHLKDSELDYANLVNSVQRHSVCNS